MAAIRNRITGLRYLHAADLLPNPRNFREHPDFQRAALLDLLAEVGISNALIAYETPAGLQLIDGHLRKDAAPDTLWPVLVLDVDEADATKLLGTLDPIGALAVTNRERLQGILDTVQTGSDAIRNVLSRTIDPASVLDDGYSVDGVLGSEMNPLAGMDPGEGRYKEQYGVIVVCADEAEQQAVYERLMGEGLACKVVVT